MSFIDDWAQAILGLVLAQLPAPADRTAKIVSVVPGTPTVVNLDMGGVDPVPTSYWSNPGFGAELAVSTPAAMVGKTVKVCNVGGMNFIEYTIAIGV